MRSILRTLVLAPAVLAAAAFASTTAMADAIVKVPFNFTVGKNNCPAGTYTVVHDRTRNLVTLRSRTTPQSFSWLVMPSERLPEGIGVILKFDELGKSYALKTVQYGDQITSQLDKKLMHSEHAPTQTIAGQ